MKLRDIPQSVDNSCKRVRRIASMLVVRSKGGTLVVRLLFSADNMPMFILSTAPPPTYLLTDKRDPSVCPGRLCNTNGRNLIGKRDRTPKIMVFIMGKEVTLSL
jgi:hypothetical protein